ncbi:claudin-7 [Microcaecilia unicolor]|uniref:Claudin n=1 Tax=Microcaecilia unicolor TaxID=1415580 RepID=A0A6P7WZ25_9AMPH|nr:claudin-7 [Microcaecilia unicolor]
MANSGLQMLGFVLALLGWIALIVATIMPQWRMSSYANDNIITAVAIYQGLWMACTTLSTGQISCKVYDSILQLDSALQATRALMVVSIVFGVLGMAVSAMGMKCTKCGGEDKVKKSRIAMVGGFLFLIGGLCALIACSWYGHQIIQDFYNPYTPVNSKYEFGAGVFIGWAGSLLAILGGALLTCSCTKKSGYSGRQYPKPAKSKAPSTTKEYV